MRYKRRENIGTIDCQVKAIVWGIILEELILELKCVRRENDGDSSDKRSSLRGCRVTNPCVPYRTLRDLRGLLLHFINLTFSQYVVSYQQ
ncbi:Nucleotide-binding oligomerization domain-containing protein [Dirofilaria immitis]